MNAETANRFSRKPPGANAPVKSAPPIVKPQERYCSPFRIRSKLLIEPATRIGTATSLTALSARIDGLWDTIPG